LGWSLARNDFPLYRRTIHRGLLWDWWAQEVSERLQQFYTDLAAGKRPKMAIMSPPQHGKTTAAIDFVTWVAGKNPNLKTIYASFSDQLGERANREVQRIMRSPAYVSIFGRIRRLQRQVPQHHGGRADQRPRTASRAHRRPAQGTQRGAVESQPRPHLELVRRRLAGPLPQGRASV
jgi:hypothetical protein